MKQLLLFFIFSPLLTFCQTEITVDVMGVPSSDGMISVAVYDTEDGFLKFESAVAFDSIVANKGMTRLSIKGLPKGEYALAIFHDENGNDILDKNWLGIPKEKVAFSKSKMKTFGPPKFKECSFMVGADQTKIEVAL